MLNSELLKYADLPKTTWYEADEYRCCECGRLLGGEDEVL